MTSGMSPSAEKIAQPCDDLKRKIVRNASANLVRLAGSGIIVLALPFFLVRTLPKDTYGAWAILLQLTVYVGYLDFGVQTAVARFVAHTEELRDFRQRDGILSTAFVLLTVAALLGFTCIGVLIWQLPAMFRQMPDSLYRSAQLALLFMGGSFAIGLPVSVIYAYFAGVQRNEVPAVIAVGNKVAMAALVVGVVLHHKGLAAMGAAVAIGNLISYAGAYVALRQLAHRVRMRLSLVSNVYARQIASYSGTLVVWMVAMLMISGLDLTIVGMFDYKSTAYYAIAATLTNFIAQAHGAIFAALLPASAVLAARGDSQQLGTMLVSSTRYGLLILLIMVLPLMVAGHFVIRKWAGADYAQHSTTILQLLLVANVVRLCALPYSTLLLGTGQQQKVIVSPLAEGVTNLTASIAGAYLIGAVGVAIGTLVGAFVGVGLHLFHNMPRTTLISIDRRRLVKDGLLRPVICVVPFALWLPFHSSISALSPQTQAWFLVVSGVGAGFLLWNYGLIHADRHRLAHALHLL
jgi:O-antigen/teichoic acid export membrane protein